MSSLAPPPGAVELMDLPDLPARDFHDALEDLAVSNRWLGGHAASMPFVLDLVRRAALDGRDPVTVLDVAGGGGDFALALLSRARRLRLRVHAILLDASPHACRHAVRARGSESALTVLRGDVTALPVRGGAVDVVHASQFLHHVPPDARAAVLARLLRLGRVGAVVADLVRDRRAAWGVAAFGRLTGRRHAFRHDGPLSVARGFTLPEARALAAETGVPDVRVLRRPFFRFTFVAGPRPLHAEQAQASPR